MCHLPESLRAGDLDRPQQQNDILSSKQHDFVDPIILDKWFRPKSKKQSNLHPNHALCCLAEEAKHIVKDNDVGLVSVPKSVKPRQRKWSKVAESCKASLQMMRRFKVVARRASLGTA